MLEACFVEGVAGRLFCVRARPSGHPPRSTTLIVPPFAEELNKSRHLLAATARRLANAGHLVVLPDLFGTGDSEGDFGDASVATWESDLERALAALGEEWVLDAAALNVIALRAGALLVPGFARSHRVAALVLIQPVTDGHKYLTRFLRLGTAAGIVGKGRESAANLKQALDDGNSVEVAGYRLSPELAAGIEGLSLSQLPPHSINSVSWCELAPSIDNPLLPASQGVVDRWRKEGLGVHSAVLQCSQFWATQELALCDRLIDVVEEALGGSTIDN